MQEKNQLRRALRVGGFVGSLQVGFVALWIGINTGWTPIKPFDPYPFMLLGRFIVFEALCYLVLLLFALRRRISQARAPVSPSRDLLTEYQAERIKKRIEAIATHLGIDPPENPKPMD